MKEKTRNIWTGIVIMIGLILAGLSGWICFSGSFVDLVQWIALGVGTLLVGESIFIILSLNPEWKGKDMGDDWKSTKVVSMFFSVLSVIAFGGLIVIFNGLVKAIGNLFSKYEGIDIVMFCWMVIVGIGFCGLVIWGYFELNKWIDGKLNKKEVVKK